MLPEMFATDEVCPACGHSFRFGLDTCPRCAHRLAFSPTYRRWVVAFMASGNLLCIIMGYIAWYVTQIIRHTGEPGATASFEGTPRDAALVLATVGVCFLCGLAMVGGGVYAFLRGRFALGPAGRARVMHALLVLQCVFWLVAAALTIVDWYGLLYG